MNDPGQMQGIDLFNMKGFASYHQRDEHDFGHNIQQYTVPTPCQTLTRERNAKVRQSEREDLFIIQSFALIKTSDYRSFSTQEYDTR